jgi:hypothetical protein
MSRKFPWEFTGAAARNLGQSFLASMEGIRGRSGFGMGFSGHLLYCTNVERRSVGGCVIMRIDAHYVY